MCFFYPSCSPISLENGFAANQLPDLFDLLDYLFCSFTIFLNSCTLKEEGKNISVRILPSISHQKENDKKVEKAWPVVLVMTSIWNMRFLLEHSRFLLAG